MGQPVRAAVPNVARHKVLARRAGAPIHPAAQLLWVSEPAMAGQLQPALASVSFEPKGPRFAPQSVQVWDLSGGC